MSTTIIKTCDRCGQDDYQKDVQFWYVGFGISGSASINVSQGNGTMRHWCRKCCVETGVFPSSEENRRKELGVGNPPVALSFEEMLREIIREEIDFSKQ